LPFSTEEVGVNLAGRSISASVDTSEAGIVVCFAEPVRVNAGETLTISTG
jgi:hypothetical protein